MTIANSAAGRRGQRAAINAIIAAVPRLAASAGHCHSASALRPSRAQASAGTPNSSGTCDTTIRIATPSMNPASTGRGT